MKILGWMHRKFRQNSSEPLKEFSIGSSCNCLTGQPSLDDLQYYPKTNYYTKHLSKTQRDYQLRRSFATLEAARAEAADLEEEASNELSELFHGFLAIGTLGSTDPMVTDPSTPTFGISIDNITEKDTEATENELKLINDELEKVLGSDDACNDSSGRNSYVSIGRSSHGSSITLSGKPLEGVESNENGSIACPLQGYLFGSAIGLPETTTGKKEHRTSLGELFQKTKMVEETSGAKCSKGEKRPEKGADKSAVHLMKNILRGRIHSSSRNSTAASGGSFDSTSAEKTMHKILQKFHRKVHPERSIDTQKSDNCPKYGMSCNFTIDRGDKNGCHLSPREVITLLPQRSVSKKGVNHFKSQSNSPPKLTASDSNGSRECWIKSDADYLVLEL